MFNFKNKKPNPFRAIVKELYSNFDKHMNAGLISFKIKDYNRAGRAKKFELHAKTMLNDTTEAKVKIYYDNDGAPLVVIEAQKTNNWHDGDNCHKGTCLCGFLPWVMLFVIKRKSKKYLASNTKKHIDTKEYDRLTEVVKAFER